MSDESRAQRGRNEPGWWPSLTAYWRRMREPRWARWLIDIAIIAALFASISWYQTRSLVDSGQTIQETTLRSLDGTTVPLVDPEAERTLVYVWAPWCGVCSAQTGTLDRARALMGDEVAVRSIVFDVQHLEDARQSAAEKGIEFPVLLGNRSIREELQVGAFPTFYVLSKDRRVLSNTQGYTTTVGLLWRTWL